MKVSARCQGSSCAEKVELRERKGKRQILKLAEARRESRRLHRRWQRVERLRSPVYTPRHKPLERQEGFRTYESVPSHVQRAERFRVPLPSSPSHKPTPEYRFYVQSSPRHRRPPQASCAPSLPSYSLEGERLACSPARPRRRVLAERQRCKRYPLPRQNYEHYTCRSPSLEHRLPSSYKVLCDAQKIGVSTSAERLAHDLRYVFTHHKKHCQVTSAYSGVSIGEWVNTQKYGRVPVAGYVMGWRTYVFAHFYDQKARRLARPRLERRRVWALKHIEVFVPAPSRSKGFRRYIEGLPGIEGFAQTSAVRLERKRLSLEETKAIQIEKLVRKRQIAWLVRAYPEERVRLPEWIKKYAGPKPPSFWPGVDHRLLEVW
ncbi:MAG: hypothetical protein RMK19_06120 [Bacteroidia bacterium]|nr:hypothetical protein [Bacteroidia bacterium]MDW8015569.1 hypothetical protein [Bacteroidia bacterium]